MPKEIKRFVLDILADFISVDVNKIGLDFSLENDLDFDSTEFICLLVKIEKSLGVKLSGLPFGEAKTVSSLVDAIDLRLQKAT